MPLNIQIVPSTDVVHMVGSQETDCQYSLSGQIVLSTTPTRSAFGTSSKAKAQPALLTSLTLTFEGGVQHYAKGEGYAARRLCTVTQTLVSKTANQPIAIPSTPEHKVAILFDLAIPGWLPATLESKHATIVETGYVLSAKATYQSDESSSLWLGNKSKSAEAPLVPITIRRNRSNAPPKRCTYALPTRSSSGAVKSTLSKEVLSSLEARATIPNYIPANSEEPFDLRLDLGSSTKDLTVHRFGVKLVQSSTYSTTPDAEFARMFPLPREKEQPPHVPLINAHELDSLFMAGISFPSNSMRVDKDDIVHPEKPSVFNMQEGERGHVLDTSMSSITVPVYIDVDTIRPTYTSPYLHIAHKLLIDLELGYQGRKERVGFTLPLPVHWDSLNRARPSIVEAMLPAYVQLYHSNGEARDVHGLPAYSKNCQPGEIKDEEGLSHPVEFRRKHLRGKSSLSSSGRSSSSRTSTDDSETSGSSGCES